MVTKIFSLLFVLTVSTALAQTVTKEYRYVERGPSDDIQFVFKGPDSLRLHSFQLSSGKTMERLGFIQADTFMMTSLRFKKRITLRKLSEDSLTLLSIRKRNKYDLDVHGRHYDWVRIKSNRWKYLSNGKPVLEARVDRAEGYHTMSVSLFDPNLSDNTVLEIASAHIAVGRIGKKSNAWMIVALAAVTGILLRPVIQNNF